MAKISAIVVCAGLGLRFGTDKLLELIGGVPVFIHSIRAFSDVAEETIVVVSKQKADVYSKIANDYGLDVKFVLGGQTRQNSVFSGVSACRAEYISVHDGARPLVSKKDIENVFRDALAFSAAILGVPVKDTIKLALNGEITETVPRKLLFAAQTPQVFRKKLYLRAFEHAEADKLNFTDDASLIENFGEKTRLTTGSYSNIKITTPEDLAVARVLYEFNNRAGL